MKYIIAATLIFLMNSCSDTFINHSIKAEKAGECNNEIAPVKIISNINGERFEFYYCMGEEFDEKNCIVTRTGDSLLVKFNNPGGKQVNYKLLLDIDAKPPYKSITLGENGQTIAMKAAERL